ncbi:histidine kinase [Rhodobacter veldkampii DSM 11550]|uniref:Histidine kinase n=1 Tax=Phaeovulum veldkampii DSM 11550 TaxID=1185920 RepID=A0A2T4JLB9_9RHOB|nr:Hpt domain-containing protein [Phaeovulum veldkampii]MBK5947089.1 histidine kinase [Phaeovulum veldkampii DSM 11550]NCU20937.1 Hpt domain-containing protein [Candidatus Falkowbacteria bacterium]PTE18701.1 histidine kinase [Phaeovulum veldkampii DSM 11550]TDQ54156.1 Hpt domain-containing protein [Phaeovulum veldkampii DSM 11550]
MIDWNRVAELREEVGAMGFSEVLDLFLEEVEGVLDTLGAQRDRLGEDLHFLKGSAWNLGFASFGVLCQAGERLLATGRAEVDIAAIRDCYARSKAQFMERAPEFCGAPVTGSAAA